MSSGSALPQVERLFRDGTVSGLSEAGLLERFLTRRDEAAFEALVARHGPLVLGVCRRMLHDPADVEDAFQATFLVLVRKARAIQRRDALGPWLYGVAYRIARRSRQTRIRQGQRERALPELEPAAEVIEPVWRDLRDVLDEELTRLPERYRAPLVLCYLQGLTHDEAAARLGCPVGTVRSRLARGRERLGVRLVRRGLAPAAGLIGVALATEAGGGVVPAALAAVTVRAAGQVVQACAVTSVVSAGVASLTKGVMDTMWWKSLAKAAVALLVVSLLVAGAFFVGRRREPQPAVASGYEIKVPKAVHRPPLTPYPSYVVEPPDLLIVEVLASLPGRPITGEHLVRPDGTIALGFYGDVYVAGLTLPEVKEKVVLHLRKFLTDDALGLWRTSVDESDREEAQRLLASDYFQQLKPPLTPPRDEMAPDDEPTAPPPPPPGGDLFSLADGGNPRVENPGDQADREEKSPDAVPAQPPSVPAVKPDPDKKAQDVLPQSVDQEKMARESASASETIWMPVHPKDSITVYVDIGSYNSKFYYVLGMPQVAGRFPCTGKETVLDAIENAGGLTWLAAPDQMRLIRPGKGDEPDQVFPIDYAAIAYGIDPSTNYQLFPGDRIVIPADPKKLAAAEKSYSSTGSAAEGPIRRLEEKLDAVLKALGKSEPETSETPAKRATGKPRVDDAPKRKESARSSKPLQPSKGQ